MCEFCEGVNNKDFTWNVRSTMADNNICEYVNGDNCEGCNECNMRFGLVKYISNENTYISVDYNQTLSDIDGNEVVISPFSEGIRINYCPFCGDSVSRDKKEFEDLYHIYEREI